MLTFSEEMVLGVEGIDFLNPAFHIQFSNCDLNILPQGHSEKLDHYIWHTLTEMHTLLNDSKEAHFPPAATSNSF